MFPDRHKTVNFLLAYKQSTNNSIAMAAGSVPKRTRCIPQLSILTRYR
jgi:hypothetical protein